MDTYVRRLSAFLPTEVCEVREGPFVDPAHDALDPDWRRAVIDAPGWVQLPASLAVSMVGLRSSARRRSRASPRCARTSAT